MMSSTVYLHIYVKKPRPLFYLTFAVKQCQFVLLASPIVRVNNFPCSSYLHLFLYVSIISLYIFYSRVINFNQFCLSLSSVLPCNCLLPFTVSLLILPQQF